MNKKSILHIVASLLFVAMFNIVFFVVGGTQHPTSVWIAYGFIHFSYFMVVATPFLTRKSSSAPVFGWTLSAISEMYFLVEFVLGLIFILISSDSYKVILVVQVIVTGAYAALLVVNLIANEQTADSVKRQEEEVAYIKDTASRVKLLMGKMSDKKTNKEIEAVYDLLHSSPSKSVASVKGLEADIYGKVSELEHAVRMSSEEKVIAISGEIIALTEERNRRIKLSN